MKKTLWVLLLALTLIAGACAAPASAPSATPVVIKTEFTPTDPATVKLAAGKPQFVEFFAFW